MLSSTLSAQDNPILSRLSKKVIQHSIDIPCQSVRLCKGGFSNGRQRFFVTLVVKVLCVHESAPTFSNINPTCGKNFPN